MRHGYACLFTSFNKTPITNLTITFVESRYSNKLIEHFEKIRGFKVAETSPGIYNISGDILPLQVIDSRRLNERENLWLKNLSNNIDAMAVKRVANESALKGKAARLQAYLNTIIAANPAASKEVIKMYNDAIVDKILEETGVTARLEARVEERKALDIARNMLNLGFSVESIASATGLNMETIASL